MDDEEIQSPLQAGQDFDQIIEQESKEDDIGIQLNIFEEESDRSDFFEMQMNLMKREHQMGKKEVIDQFEMFVNQPRKNNRQTEHRIRRQTSIKNVRNLQAPQKDDLS